MRVLCIEPDHATAQSIELMLKSEGFNVYTTDLGEEGIDLGKIYDYDIILLELNLPDMHGLEVLRQLRVGKVNTPVFVLTGTSDIETKVKTFGGGADDFMTKPFHKDELIARTHAVVRRSKGHAQAVITTGKMAVNLDSKTVEVNGRKVHLTGKEYMMLELLSLRKGSTLTKEMFLNHLYGGMDEPELKIIDVFICKVRKKIASATGGQHYIETVWGRGYVLREPDAGAATIAATEPAHSVEEPAQPEPVADVQELEPVFDPAPEPVHVAPVLTVITTPTPTGQERHGGRHIMPHTVARMNAVLGELAKGPARTGRLHVVLRELEEGMPIETARAIIAAGIRQGYLVNENPGTKAAIYAITDEGRKQVPVADAA